MQPEISHRCPACGVSIRDDGDRVMFCPECGKPLAETSVENTKTDAVADSTELAAGAPPIVSPVGGGQTEIVAKEDDSQKPAGEDRHSARERTREKLQRASQMTRGAIEGNVKRVEKIHHVSTVVLEEATYDPSLRFVLVALGLFVLAVVLLVLSKVMG
jgi:predicted  nucleic acid-binding Zn-ribbon protein